MIDKALLEIQDNIRYNPDRWNEIKRKAAGLNSHFQEVIDNKRRSKDRIIHFAAFVSNDAMYGMDAVFSLMMARDDRWDCKVVIIPDVSRGYPHQRDTYIRCREYFATHYGDDYVVDGWDMETDEYIDVMDDYDIIYFANPYDSMAVEVHSIQYAVTRNVLPVYVNYGYDVGYKTMYARMKGPELNYVWKYFTETIYSYEEIRKLQIINGANVNLTGYTKMDAYSRVNGKTKSRKKILIASHHTVKMDELPLSCFMMYHELILSLPKMFPDIDFVFRPHPLLFIRMINDNVWTKNMVDDYLSKIKKAGIEYSNGGEYFRLFSECDAIINDCGSFTLEWLFTGKPGCFVLNDKLSDEHITTQMKEGIKRYSIAHTNDDIVNFVRDIDADNYSKKQKMDEWVRNNIAINYPNAAKVILEEMDILQ